MSTRNAHWYNLNESRDFPIDDTSTCLSDAGIRLPQSIIADVRLRYPSDLGQYAFISAVTVTETAVTVLFQAATSRSNVEAVFTPLASVTVLRSDLSVRWQHPLEAQYPGVFGYIVFGNGAEDPFQGRFSSPAQTMLTPRAVRPYLRLPIASLGKMSNLTALTGLVLLQGEAPVEVVKESRTIDGVYRDVIVVRLVEDESTTGSASVLSKFVGPCGGRPDSRSCDDPQPVEFINSVGPFYDGTLELEIAGDAVAGYTEDASTLVIDSNLGLADACMPPHLPDESGYLPVEFETLPYEPVSMLAMRAGPESGYSVHEDIVVLGELPYEDDFTDGRAKDFVVRDGEFSFVEDDRKTCYASEGRQDSVNLSVWKSFDDIVTNRIISTELKLTSDTGFAGLMFGFGTHGTTYFVEANPATGQYRIRQNDRDVERIMFSTTGQVLAVNTWIPLSVALNVVDNKVQVTVKSGPTVIGPVILPGYTASKGESGLVVNKAKARFRRFRVEEYVSTG